VGEGYFHEHYLRRVISNGFEGGGAVLCQAGLVAPKLKEQAEALGGVPEGVHDQHAGREGWHVRLL
jgi:hypothetical protein